jgi:hypothetical protein
LLGPLVGVLITLTACQSSPGLPTVDDSQRRPVNQAAAIELQTCKAEASALPIELQTCKADASVLRATLAETTAPQCGKTSSTMAIAAPVLAGKSSAQQTGIAATEAPADRAPTRLAVFVFEHNQTTLSVDEETRAALVAAAQEAHTVHIRARSGGNADSGVDVQAARRRAEAAAALLRELGVPTAKLRVSWQGMGDAPVDAASGRRVELEFVQQAPVMLFTRPAQAPQGTTQTASAAPRSVATTNATAEARAHAVAQALTTAAASSQTSAQPAAAHRLAQRAAEASRP